MKMNKIKLALFLLFSLIAPCAYLIIRYDLFKPTSALQIGIWGIAVICIFLSVITTLIRYYLEGMKTKYSFLKQVLEGLIKVVLPLALALVIIVWVGDNVSLLKESLLVIIPCESVAVFLNPLPKWCFENNVEGIGEIADKIINKTKKGE